VESYWVLPEQFLAGEYPAHVDREDGHVRLEALLSAGIDTFIDLTEPNELPPYAPLLKQCAARRRLKARHERFPIADFGLPERGEMLKILDRIDKALADRHKVYLHCWGGVGRTGLTVGCFLVRHGMTGAQALNQIVEWRQSIPNRKYSLRSPETPEQVQFILDLWGSAPAGKR